MDVLSYLKSELVEGRILQVTKDADLNMLIFSKNKGEYACRCDDATNYRKSGKGGDGATYTIESIWFLVQRLDLPHGNYIIKAKQAGVPTVERADRKELLSYMKGEISTAKNIDQSVYVASVQPTEELRAALQEEVAAAAPPAKRARVEDGVSSTDAADASAPPAAMEMGAVQKVTISAADLKERTKKILSREVTYEDRHTMLRGSKPFTTVLEYISSKKKDPKSRSGDPKGQTSARPTKEKYDRYDQPAARAQGAEFGINDGGGVDERASDPKKARSTPKAKSTDPSKKKKHLKQVPIIIVPSGMRDMLTLHNVRDFLEKGQFIDTSANQTEKPSSVMIEKKRAAGIVPYKVIDNVNGMTREQWDRVIAVFVSGPEWQFKRWPMFQENGTAGVFTRVRGFYLHMEGAKEHANIRKWDVTTLTISESKRHMDMTSQLRFWQVLDNFSSKFAGYLRL